MRMGSLCRKQQKMWRMVLMEVESWVGGGISLTSRLGNEEERGLTRKL